MESPPQRPVCQNCSQLPTLQFHPAYNPHRRVAIQIIELLVTTIIRTDINFQIFTPNTSAANLA